MRARTVLSAILVLILLFPAAGYAQLPQPNQHLPADDPVRFLSVQHNGDYDGAPIRLRVGTFTPVRGETLSIPPDLAVTDDEPEGSAYYIVQFQGPIYEEWKTRIAALGGVVLDYVPDFAFVVSMDGAARARVDKLAEVVWIGPFQPAYKLSPDLTDAQGPLDLVVLTFPTEPVEAISDQISELGASVQDSSERSIGGQLRLTIDAMQLIALAHVPAVRWIEPFYERVLFNDVSRGNTIMAAETLWSQQGLYGAGQVVAVTDTGLDTGNLSTIHQDFRGSPAGCSGTDRILATYALGRTGDWSDSCKRGNTSHGGHGTHVAGSVLGNGCQSGSSGAPDYGGSYAGLAPQAGLVFQSVMDSSCGLGGLPADLNTLFAQAQAAGARIHTNSWGAAVSGQYTTDSENTDEYLWNHKDYTILFSAGNEGTDSGTRDGYIDADSIGAPGTAKNCITVGASENYRLTGGYNPGGACSTWGGCWPTDYSTNPIRDDRLSNNVVGMVAFSSRGPTDDGRYKPDVVAPGSNILSTKSQAQYVSGGWGAGPNQYYQYMGGTSMSTPLTAGAMALIRDWYTDVKLVTPSGALLKATVINSAVNMYPGQYGSPLEQQPQLPNNAQGWGRVNVANATDDSHQFQDIPDATGLSTGGSHAYNYQVCTAPVFKVTLVWTDYPGSTLVNDLDLVVTAPVGTVYRGNVFADGWSTSGGSADRTNNVESVYIQSPAAGDWTVTVSGYNVPQGTRQAYALVVDIPDNLCDPDFTIDATPASLDVCTYNDATFSVAVGQIAGFSAPVVLSTGVLPGSTTASFTPPSVTPPGASVLTIGNTGSAAAGTYDIDVIGTSGATVHQDTVTLNLYEVAPGAVSLPAPADGATSQPTQPAFSWAAVSGATSYSIQIATDPGFATIVDSASGLTSPTYTPATALNANWVYYWRVQAINPCGTGDYSAIWAFRTVNCTPVGPITHSTSQIILAGNSVSCNADDLHADNSYLRKFTLADFGISGSLDVTSVDVGIESATSGAGGSQPATMNLYTWDPADPFSWANFTSIGTADTMVADQNLTILNVPVAGHVPAGGTLAVEFFTPDGQAAGHSLYVGSNGLGQSDYTYLAAADCGIVEPTTTDILGFPNMHLVMNVYGDECTSSVAADYSDLASGYGVAWQTGDGALRLGGALDWDTDTGFAVDSDNDTDNGVSFDPTTGWKEGSLVRIYVEVTGADSDDYLAGWFDWNDDGDFADPQEKVLEVRTLVAGSNAIEFTIPTGVGYADGREVNARLRLYEQEPAIQGSELPYGEGTGGEVEDDRWVPPAPTAVKLTSFTAGPTPAGILVTWETASEHDNAGFNLYRSATLGDIGVRLNQTLIPSASPGGDQGAVYDFLDAAVLPGVTYYTLEDVDLSGHRTPHGPVAAALWRVYLPVVGR